MTLDFCNAYKGTLKKKGLLRILRAILIAPENVAYKSEFFELAQQMITLTKKIENEMIVLNRTPKEF